MGACHAWLQRARPAGSGPTSRLPPLLGCKLPCLLSRPSAIHTACNPLTPYTTPSRVTPHPPLRYLFCELDDPGFGTRARALHTALLDALARQGQGQGRQGTTQGQQGPNQGLLVLDTIRRQVGAVWCGVVWVRTQLSYVRRSGALPLLFLSVHALPRRPQRPAKHCVQLVPHRSRPSHSPCHHSPRASRRAAASPPQVDLVKQLKAVIRELKSSKVRHVHAMPGVWGRARIADTHSGGPKWKMQCNHVMGCSVASVGG